MAEFLGFQALPIKLMRPAERVQAIKNFPCRTVPRWLA
jgi:hypothetical protein